MGRPKKASGDFPLPKTTIAEVTKTPLFSGRLNEHSVFKWVMMHIQSKHPAWKTLPQDASITTRASHQIKCETFQGIVNDLWALADKTNAATLESTYGIEENNNQQ